MNVNDYIKKKTETGSEREIIIIISDNKLKNCTIECEEIFKNFIPSRYFYKFFLNSLHTYLSKYRRTNKLKDQKLDKT